MTGTVTDIEKIAIDAVIKRQQSLLELMRHTDNRSQQFIVAYSGFMGAALLFSAREFSATHAELSTNHSNTVAAAFVITYAVSLLAAAIFGFLAIRPAELGLASRGPDFWKWALKNENSASAIHAFLEEADKHVLENEKIQKRAVKMLGRSMWCGGVAILVSGVGSFVVVARAIF
ncbi:MAG: hypothetical protein ABL907_03150 [Hyphomicrobium sp.]